MNIERPGSPSATTVAPVSKRTSTSIEIKRSRPVPERPPKNGVASKNVFSSGELAVMEIIYARRLWRQARDTVRWQFFRFTRRLSEAKPASGGLPNGPITAGMQGAGDK